MTARTAEELVGSWNTGQGIMGDSHFMLSNLIDRTNQRYGGRDENRYRDRYIPRVLHLVRN